MKGIAKKNVWSFIMCLAFVLPVLAQDHRDHNEKIEAIKVAFITNKLDLTTEEAQKFWPIYNDYQKEWMDLMRKKRAARMSGTADADQRINMDLDYENKMLDLKKKYKRLYLKAIPVEKILLLYQAEREFREHLIKQLRGRRGAENH